MLLESSSPPHWLPLGLGSFILLETDEIEGALEGGVEGDWRLGGRLDFGGVGDGLLSLLRSLRE